MARAAMVTRTISATKCVCLCVDVNSGKTFESTYLLPKVYKDAHKMYKDLQRMYNDETLKIVVVKSYEVVETKYGMSVEKFIKEAEQI